MSDTHPPTQLDGYAWCPSPDTSPVVNEGPSQTLPVLPSRAEDYLLSSGTGDGLETHFGYENMSLGLLEILFTLPEASCYVIIKLGLNY